MREPDQLCSRATLEGYMSRLRGVGIRSNDALIPDVTTMALLGFIEDQQRAIDALTDELAKTYAKVAELASAVYGPRPDWNKW